MSNIFDDVAVAFTTLMQSRCGAAFKSYNRGVKLYQDVIDDIGKPIDGPGNVFPQFWFYEGVGLGGGTIEYAPAPMRGVGGPQSGTSKRTMSRTIVMYDLKPKANTPEGADGSVTGMLQLNPLLAIVEAAMVPDAPSFGTLTLGGLVAHCWIEGEVYSIPGDIDPSGLAMQTVPVKILIP